MRGHIPRDSRNSEPRALNLEGPPMSHDEWTLLTALLLVLLTTLGRGHILQRLSAHQE